MNVRDIVKNASKWRRYMGQEHGRPGGINIDPILAVECAMKIRLPASGNVDVLASKRSGSNIKNEFSFFYQQSK